MITIRSQLAIACAVLLAACGGGDGAGPAPATAMNSDLPNVATQDPNAAVGFAVSLAAKTSDTSEPVRTGSDVFATSETAEPQ